MWLKHGIKPWYSLTEPLLCDYVVDELRRKFREKFPDKMTELDAFLFQVFLTYDSVKIQAKVLWLLGEIGLVHTLLIQDAVPGIASFCDSPVPLLRERAVNALKIKICRGDK